MAIPTSLRSILALTAEQATAVLWAAVAIAESDGAAIGQRTAELLDTASHGLEVVLEPWMKTRSLPGNLGEVFPSAKERRHLVDALILVVCIEGEVQPRRQRALVELAAALGVRSHWVTLIDAFAHRRLLTIKRAVGTRSPDVRRLFSRVWREEGLLGMLRALWFVMGFYRDRQLAARFHALERLAPGTFGRAIFDHCDTRHIPFPGDKGGMPERMMHHDLMHVLNGFDTDAAGECEIAGFYAGFTDGDSFTFIMTVLATFQLGLEVSPAVVKPDRGAFRPARVLRAYLRGRQLTIDVMGPWDYWELMPLSLAEAQARLGLPPGQG